MYTICKRTLTRVHVEPLRTGKNTNNLIEKEEKDMINENLLPVKV